MAWFIIDYFAHNLSLISQARKNFRLQNSADDTVLAEQSDTIGTLNGLIRYSLAYQQIFQVKQLAQFPKTKTILRNPLTTDATPLNYNSFLPDRTGNNSLNSSLIQQKILKGNRNLTQQDIQTPSHFTSEEVVTTVITTTQQSISPIHPNLITPRPKNPTLPQVTLQSTVKTHRCPKITTYELSTI